MSRLHGLLHSRISSRRGLCHAWAVACVCCPVVRWRGAAGGTRARRAPLLCACGPRSRASSPSVARRSRRRVAAVCPAAVVRAAPPLLSLRRLRPLPLPCSAGCASLPRRVWLVRAARAVRACPLTLRVPVRANCRSSSRPPRRREGVARSHGIGCTPATPSQPRGGHARVTTATPVAHAPQLTARRHRSLDDRFRGS